MKELLQQALDALADCTDEPVRPRAYRTAQNAITALREALAAPMQEPVAWVAVSDKMPPEDVPCWLYEPGIGAWIGGWSNDADGWLWHHCHGSQYMCADGDWESTDAEADDYNPTHWMPLPAAPGATPPAAPADMVMVPREPTPEMIEAADQSDKEYSLRAFGPGTVLAQSGYDHWVAMIAAAPPAAPAPVVPEGNPCGAHAVGGPCVLPAGHNMGRADVPANHQSAAPVVREPLTDEQVAVACGWKTGCKPLPQELWIARAIERAHGITGGSK